MGSYDPMPSRTALEDAHETSEAHDGQREVKYPFAFKNLDWDDYHRYRPRYPDSMLKQWMSYHRLHGGDFDCAHDMGAGPGTLASRLAPLFTNMIISDAGAANIRSAKANLASPSNKPTKFTFLHTPAEQSHATLPPASVDFVSVGMAFHYFDAPLAIRSIATMLKPGGTLAAATYGFRLRFPGRPALERLWFAAASKESLRLIREGALFPAAVKGLAAAMAGLDFVELPEAWFEVGATRVLVNGDGMDEGEEEKEGDDDEDDDEEMQQARSTKNGSNGPGPLAFVEEDACWEPSVRRVGPADVCKRTRDAGWRREADCAWLRGFLASCQMGFGQRTWETTEWRMLEEIVRSAEGGRVLVEWPVAMILATRNARPVV
ncbi:hypothetical protein N0V82_008760 [Gnomoniopsis sp. IMI 355080]|nr:hypothetical protein N0V82_008760 [Gnomoniopsis sp. IMI 355080]